MSVICLLNQKGGVGKTTLALNIAVSFALAGDAVLYVDADPQANALDWSAVRQRPPLFNVVVSLGIPGTAERSRSGSEEEFGECRSASGLNTSAASVRYRRGVILTRPGGAFSQPAP